MLPWSEETIMIYGGEVAAETKINDGIIVNVADKMNIETVKKYPHNDASICFSFPNNSYVVKEDKSILAAGVEFQAEINNQSIIELKFSTDGSTNLISHLASEIPLAQRCSPKNDSFVDANLSDDEPIADTTVPTNKQPRASQIIRTKLP